MQFYEPICQNSIVKIHKGLEGRLRNSLNSMLLYSCRLGLSLEGFLRLALSLALQLIRSTNRDILGAEVAEEVLENVFDDVASSIVEDHQHSQSELELVGEGDQAQLLIDFRNELGGTRECAGGCSNKTPVHSLVLSDGFTERSALVVDGEGGDLLDQLEKVDCTVQQRRLEFALKINIIISPIRLLVKLVLVPLLQVKQSLTAHAYKRS